MKVKGAWWDMGTNIYEGQSVDDEMNQMIASFLSSHLFIQVVTIQQHIVNRRRKQMY